MNVLHGAVAVHGLVFEPLVETYSDVVADQALLVPLAAEIRRDIAKVTTTGQRFFRVGTRRAGAPARGGAELGRRLGRPMKRCSLEDGADVRGRRAFIARNRRRFDAALPALERRGHLARLIRAGSYDAIRPEFGVDVRGGMIDRVPAPGPG